MGQTSNIMMVNQRQRPFEDSNTIQPDNDTPSPEILPSSMILVWPMTAENTPCWKIRRFQLGKSPCVCAFRSKAEVFNVF